MRLMRERPTSDISGSLLFYYYDNAIHQYHIDQQTDIVVGQAKPRPAAGRGSPLDPPPQRFRYSAIRNRWLAGHKDRTRTYTLGTDDVKLIDGFDPVWVPRNQYAWLAKGQLFVSEVNGVSATTVNIPKTFRLFPACSRAYFSGFGRSNNTF
jgi:hypothetical protein